MRLMLLAGLFLVASGCKGPPVLDGTRIESEEHIQSFLDKLTGTSEAKKRFVPLDAADVDDLPGSILFETKRADGTSEWWFEPVRNTSVALRPERAENKLFEGIVDRKFVAGANVSFFATLNASMGIEDKAQILISEMYMLKGPARSDVQTRIDAWVAANVASLKVRQAIYVRNINVGAIDSRIYRKTAGEVKIDGPVFGVNGTYYKQHQVNALERIVSFDGVPIPIGTPDTLSPKMMVLPSIRKGKPGI